MIRLRRHPRHHRAFALSATTLLLASTACDAPESTPGLVTRDSAGVAIAINADFDPPEWEVGEPLLALGSTSDEGPEQFFRVGGARIVEVGEERVLFVADGGASEIRRFAMDGKFLGAWGRRGEGPGEFGAPGPIWAVPGDSVAVWDRRNGRLSVFDFEGNLGREMARIPMPNVEPVAPRPDGSLLVTSNLLRMSEEFTMAELDIALVHPDGRVDSLPSQPLALFGQVGETPRPFIVTPHFGARTVVAGDSTGYWVATGQKDELMRYTSTGALGLIARWPERERSIPPGAVEALLEEQLAQVPEAMHADFRRQHAATPTAEAAAATGYAIAGPDGELWFETPEIPDREGTVWRVVNREGRLIGRLRLPEFPERFLPLDVGRDYLVGIVRDEVGVEFVHVYPLDRTPAATGG
ncbi:MAG: hypothetical protein RQ745_01805 [Longimicrobiales bacterium]|nr:hypothetical protein [Longimicrobiales bacterium]